MNLGVSLSLVAPGELAATEIAGERLFTRVRADVRSEVVATAEVPHAYAALERFVSCVDANVPCQFVRAGETPVAALRRARVGPLVDGRLAWSVRVLAGAKDWPKGQVLRAVG